MRWETTPGIKPGGTGAENPGMRSLRFKILALAGLVVVVTQLGTIGAVLFTANREVAARAEQMLRMAGAVSGQVATGRGARLRSGGSMLANDPRLQTAVARGDLASARLILNEQQIRSEADLIMLLDPDGKVLAGGGIGESGDAFPGLVSNVPAPAGLSAVVELGGHTYEAVSLPVGGSRPSAWLSVGSRLDGSFAARLASLINLDVTLLAPGGKSTRILGSSLSAPDAAALLGSLTDGSARPGATLRARAGDREHVALRLPLIPGVPDVDVLLSEPLDAVMAPFATLRLSVLLLSGIALCLAMAGGAFLSRTITEPVHELVRAARRIRDGDYRQPVLVRAGAEVAELSNALNVMQKSIAEREERITYQAAFDALTGLPTRLSATTAIAAAIASPGTASDPVTVLLVDLDNFSDIGSSLGHDIGDALRSQAAERLRAGLDARHLLARLEGDQFLAVLRGVGVGQAEAMAEDLLRLLGAGLSVRDVSLAVEASVGIAGYPDHATDAEQLLQRAAFACREARHSDKDVFVYQAGNEERHVRQLAILADLRRGARHDEFRLYLQPKIRLSDGTVCGAEALVRWQHPSLGFLTPDQFIPVAEKSGNISLITHWALTAAIRECRLWIEDGLNIPVAVNISGRDLHNSNLPFQVLQLLRNHDLPARNLVLEITENAVVRDFQRATLVLECLRDLGIRISVDDFGTGYSSLSQLKHLPVDELKIDRSFVLDLPGNRDDAAIVRASIDLAHDLGLEVLAEGVECAAARDWLRERGCELAQGYLFSKPLPADQFQAWVRTYEQEPSRGLATLRAAS